MNKFEFKDNRPLKKKVMNFLQSLLFWKGRKKGIVYTRNLEWIDLKEIFFPTKFREKYMYLGSIPWKEEGDLFQAIYPLVIAMDYKAKPKWCPRWVLRFLYVFGADKSIVRVRNSFYANLLSRLTKGILLWDYKTKWSYYDLRISITGPNSLQDLADDIERGFYFRGRQEELVEKIKKLDPKANIIYGSIERLEKQLEELVKVQRETIIKIMKDDEDLGLYDD